MEARMSFSRVADIRDYLPAAVVEARVARLGATSPSPRPDGAAMIFGAGLGAGVLLALAALVAVALF
jgi:hypothetical protein